MKVKRMGIKDILKSSYLLKKKPESVSEKLSQVNSNSNSTHHCDR